MNVPIVSGERYESIAPNGTYITLKVFDIILEYYRPTKEMTTFQFK